MGLLTLSELYKLDCILFIYKCLYSDKFEYFMNKMNRGSDFHDHNTRNNSNFRLHEDSLKGQLSLAIFIYNKNAWKVQKIDLTFL